MSRGTACSYFYSGGIRYLNHYDVTEMFFTAVNKKGSNRLKRLNCSIACSVVDKVETIKDLFSSNAPCSDLSKKLSIAFRQLVLFDKTNLKSILDYGVT